jgi:hypothetical protein
MNHFQPFNLLERRWARTTRLDRKPIDSVATECRAYSQARRNAACMAFWGCNRYRPLVACRVLPNCFKLSSPEGDMGESLGEALFRRIFRFANSE